MRADRAFSLLPILAFLPFAVALLGSLLSSAAAQSLHGYGQLQYQKLDGAQANDREWWVRSFEIDYARRIKDTFDLTSQVQLVDLDYTGRPDRSRIPFA